MARDYFAILGLAPGRYSPREITRRFTAQRRRVIAELHDPDEYETSRQQLDDLHIAYRTLSDPDRQAEYLRFQKAGADRVAELRALITASLEGGLIRHSRRQAIIDQAGKLGLNEFQTQLLIAQVQFGDEEIPAAPRQPATVVRSQHPRIWARAAAAGVVGLAMFLYLVHWVSA